VGDLRAVNNNFLDTYHLKSQNAVIDGAVQKIEKIGDKYCVHITYSHAKGQTALVEYDKVILCTGFKFDDAIYDESARPNGVYMDKLPGQTPEWQSANVPDMYFAGTLMAACDFHKTMSGFIHGFRHNIESLVNVLEMKYYGTPWPSDEFEAAPQTVMQKVIDRATAAPGMFLQPGFLGDVFVVSNDDNTIKYYNDLRLDYVPVSEFSHNDHYYTVSLEYGHFDDDPFSIERDPDPDKGAEAPYLHPIIRRYERGKLVNEHHVQDDLENAWYKDIYTRPALAYFEEQLAMRSEDRIESKEMA
jgi:hypothetical protein